jgi:hypothetical protein
MKKEKEINPDESPESIKAYKGDDAVFLRNAYLEVIELHKQDGKIRGTHQEIKNLLKALSDLAKLQHLLQKDKEDSGDKSKEVSPFTPDEEKELDERLTATLGDSWIESSDNT